MPLQKVTAQSYKSIEQYYLDLSQENNGDDRGNAMLGLIELLNTVLLDTIWCFTSHQDLVLTPTDATDQGKTHVKVVCFSFTMFYIEYMVREGEGPWPHAMMRGYADSVAKAKDYVLIAMKESGGWQ